MAAPYRTPAPFTCPQCGAQHDRGWVDGVETCRCLHCGYVGKDNAPPPPKPLTDSEFRQVFVDLLSVEMGPIYLNPMVVARIRKLFTSVLDFPTIPQGTLVGTMYGIELYQTRYVPDGWAYCPPGGHHEVMRGHPADTNYLRQLDPTAEPYVPPPPILSRYDRLMSND